MSYFDLVLLDRCYANCFYLSVAFTIHMISYYLTESWLHAGLISTLSFVVMVKLCKVNHLCYKYSILSDSQKDYFQGIINCMSTGNHCYVSRLEIESLIDSMLS